MHHWRFYGDAINHTPGSRYWMTLDEKQDMEEFLHDNDDDGKVTDTFLQSIPYGANDVAKLRWHWEQLWAVHDESCPNRKHNKDQRSFAQVCLSSDDGLRGMTLGDLDERLDHVAANILAMAARWHEEGVYACFRFSIGDYRDHILERVMAKIEDNCLWQETHVFFIDQYESKVAQALRELARNPY